MAEKAEKNNQQQSKGTAKENRTLPVEFEVRIHSIKPNEAVKATASVNINGMFAIRGVKIVEGSNGLFVAMPSYKAGGEYKDICFPITAECREQLHGALMSAYEEAILQGQTSVAKQREMKQPPEGQTMDMP